MRIILPLAIVAFTLLGIVSARATPLSWGLEWPVTDFSNKSIDLGEILSGGPPKDGIPSIDDPKFIEATKDQSLAETEPVIGLIINSDARAYPLRILMWHEIVNDTVGGVPVSVTYCPLCNSAIVFERKIEGKVTTFGTTGKLRNSDMVMYDRLTESWWQQFLGEAIVGKMTGMRLKSLPARLESFHEFKQRAPAGKVQIPTDPNLRDYGRNPYAFYDSRKGPYELFTGPFPQYIDPMVRVVVVDGKAWALPLIREKGRIIDGDLLLSWKPGQSSALDSPAIREGRDVGNVTVQRQSGDKLEDTVYDVTFAFVYHAFHQDRKIVTE